MTQSYCVASATHPLHRAYHDNEYGVPIREDAGLFQRLALEIAQAGLSWLTVLKKQAAFERAFLGFDIDRVAAMTDEDRARLLADPGIIRNRLKIAAIIDNARRLQRLRHEYGGFALWLDRHHPRDRSDWTRLFKATFRFTGPEIVGSFLISTGYLPGAHDKDCPVYATVLAQHPPWAQGLL